MTQPLHVVRHMSEAVSQTSPMAQVVDPPTQRSVVSLQVSAPLQATESSQNELAAPAHMPPEQTSVRVQNSPSSQVAPSFAVQATREAAALQISH
jgi:hypothetical protein